MSVTSSRSKASILTVDDASFSMVAAIDIGTSYSGYAYCNRRELDENTDNILLNPMWSSSKTVSSFKTPTYLLLNEKREFEAFGYEAEKRYADLQQQGRHLRCFFFRRFKTKLYGNQGLKANHALKDELGKAIPAIKVFSMCIRYLKGHLLNALRMRGKDVSTEDIKWMITIPSIWSDVSKQFMRQAAVQAGIPGERLKLALEAEVASIYCQNLPRPKGSSKQPICVPGTNYVVADIGGGKTDVIFHQLRPDNRLKELTKSGGCLVGSGHVDNALLQFLVRMLGAPAVREWLDDFKVEFLELIKEFDVVKRLVGPDQRGPITLKVPVNLDRIVKQKQNGESVEKVISKSVYRDKVHIVDGKMQIDAKMCAELFRSTCIEVAKSIKNVLTCKSAKKCTYLILVGGMAESATMQDIVRQELEGSTSIQSIIVPPEPEIAVLKGAVLFGHQNRCIMQRVIRYTYGLRKAKLFNPDMHPADKMSTLHGIDYITDVFSPFITAGSRAPVGFMSYDSLTSIEPFQKAIEIDVYFSTELDPAFVTDKNCWLLGKIEYQIPTPSKEERTIYIEFIFGDTELVMNITDRKTASKFKNTFPEVEK